MKKALLLILSFLFTVTSNAQYIIDWANAPVNPVPGKYTLNHFNLRGKVKSRTQGTTFNFDERGNLTKSETVFPSTNFYDKNGNLERIVQEYDRSSAFYTVDEKGRITQKRNAGGEIGTNFTYNQKGLWIAANNLAGKPEIKNTYDAAGRIIKVENFEILPYVEEFSYKKIGSDLEVKTVKTSTKLPTTTKISVYNKKGDIISYNGDKWILQYDNQDNIISVGMSGGTNKYTYTYYETSANKNASKPNDCLNGNCENGVGSINIGEYEYVGFFENGNPHGPGLLKKSQTTDYLLHGNWMDGENKGFGILNDNKQYFQGNFKDKVLNGRGVVREKGVYQYGNFLNGKIVEPPYHFYENKNVTKGCVAGDCKDLYGRFVFENESKYTGFFRNSNPESGIFNDKYKNIYSGEFSNVGEKDGIGKQDFTNGDTYFGEFKNGKRHGKGMYVSREKGVFVEIWGTWNADQLVKRLRQTDKVTPNFYPTPAGPGNIQTSGNFPDLGFRDPFPDPTTLNKNKNKNSTSQKKEVQPLITEDFLKDPFGFLFNDKEKFSQEVAIGKLYPGFPSSDKKSISKKINAEAAKKKSKVNAAKYTAEKIQELYAIDKKIAFETWSWIEPEDLVENSEKLLTEEQRIYFQKETKILVDKFLNKKP